MNTRVKYESPTSYNIKVNVNIIIFTDGHSSVGTRGLKSRMCHPYPHACRKRRLKWGAVTQVADTALSTNLT